MGIDNKQVESLVKEWFSKTASFEWRRLKSDPYRRIEFLVTMHFLERYLPKDGLVLDAGGGPGRYAIDLASRGYNVILLDLVPEMLKIAKKRIRRAGVQPRIKQIVQGSIEDLSIFDEYNFDAVLCLGGPLGHLLKVKQREKAASELIRVAKAGAPIFVSVISRIGLLKTILIEFPHEMKYARHHWETGNYVPGLQGEGFTAAHWFKPEELRELFEGLGTQTLDLVGLEGLSSHHRRETNRLHKDSEKWEMWVEMLLDTCTDPSIVGSSEHFLLVCRKQGQATRRRSKTLRGRT